MTVAALTLPRKRTTDRVSGLDELAQKTFVFESDTYNLLVQLRQNMIALQNAKVSPLTAPLDCAGYNLTSAGLIQGAPQTFAWASNAASIDVSTCNDFAASNTLTGNSALTLLNGIDGCQGTIYVKQDGTGSRTLSFTVSGRTILRDESATDSNPQSAANTLTCYSYDFKTIAGTAYIVIVRAKLT